MAVCVFADILVSFPKWQIFGLSKARADYVDQYEPHVTHALPSSVAFSAISLPPHLILGRQFRNKANANFKSF